MAVMSENETTVCFFGRNIKESLIRKNQLSQFMLQNYDKAPISRIKQAFNFRFLFEYARYQTNHSDSVAK